MDWLSWGAGIEAGNAATPVSQDNQIIFQDYSGANLAVIQQNGNVGIGTTGPFNKFHTNLTTGQLALFGGIGLGVTDQNFTGIALGYSEAGSFYQKSAIVQMQTGDGAARGTILFLNNNTNSSANAGIADARMAITAAGNVGIGTTGPLGILDVIGNSSVLLRAGQSSLQLSGSAASTTADIQLAAADRIDLFASSLSLQTSSTSAGDLKIISKGSLILDTSSSLGDRPRSFCRAATSASGRRDPWEFWM